MPIKKSKPRPRKIARKAKGASTNHGVDSPLPRGLAIAAIGASAGGLEALTQLVEALPRDPGLVLVILQHMAADHESALPYLLGRHTPMPVKEVTHGLQVRANHIYVVPPNVQMTMSGDRLMLTSRPADRSRHTPIDTFFSSVADAAGNRAIAVVLSGSASDGSLGIRDVKAAGGITIAQQPETAKYDSMPRAAIASGFIDLVLDAAAIGKELVIIARHPYVRPTRPHPADQIGDPHLNEVFDLLRPVSGVDFRHYKQPTIRRRLLRRMALHRSESIEHYIKLLRNDSHELRGLFQDLLIHVTRFFREPDSFAALRKDVIPKLIKSVAADQPLRFWVCGCATGEEAYSLAITTVEALDAVSKSDTRVQIFATDISDSAVDQARSGSYSESIEADVGPARLKRFFTRIDGQYRVSKQLRDMCVFAKQDVTKDPPFSRLDLVMCRNVLIYMDNTLQRRLLGMFHYALRPHGYLMLGQAEGVGTQAGLFALADKKHRIHRKKSVPAALPAMTMPADAVPQLLRRRGGDGPGRPDKTLEMETSRVLIERYAPSGVVVDADMQIVQFRGHTGDYLEPSPGEASLNLLKMAKEGLLHGLRTAIVSARKSQKPLRRDGLHVRSGDEWRPVALEVVPLTALGRQHFLVLFEKSAPAAAGKSTKANKRTSRAKQATTVDTTKLELMERELTASRDYLQSVIQELEAANEELQSANEEILSSNEELQSTNEELDTAKEELQSTNEELNTVNEELQTRNEEVGRVNSDLVNLLASIQVAIVIVGNDLRIRRFTPMAEKVLNLVPTDIGRSIAHINPNIDTLSLRQLIGECLDSMTLVERDVQDRQGRWYSLRIRPYKSLDNKIDGAVLALFDVDVLKRSERGEAPAAAASS